jgi:hypothetical protein
MPPTALIPEKAHPILHLSVAGWTSELVWAYLIIIIIIKEITLLSPAKNQPTILRIFRLTYLLHGAESFLRS